MNILKIILGGILIIIIFNNCKRNPSASSSLNLNEERILFSRGGKNIRQICSITPNGESLKVIANYDRTQEGFFHLRWSPDKTVLAGDGGPGSTLDYWPIWLLDNECNLIKKITRNGKNPMWINNKNLIYSKTYYANPGVYEYDCEKDIEDNLFTFGLNDSLTFQLSDISRTGKKALGYSAILLSTDSTGLRLYERSVAEFNLVSWEFKKILTNVNLSLNILPKWSPDEDLIIYSLIDDNATRNLYLMTSEGDSLRQLTYESLWNPFSFSDFVWSPDGEKIAFSKQTQSGVSDIFKDIYILDINDNLDIQLTNTSQDSIGNGVYDWR